MFLDNFQISFDYALTHIVVKFDFASFFFFYPVCFQISGSDDENGDIDWDNLGFGIKQTDYMYVTKSTCDGVFEQGQLSRFGNIELNPSAGVLNYGQVKSFFRLRPSKSFNVFR